MLEFVYEKTFRDRGSGNVQYIVQYDLLNYAKLFTNEKTFRDRGSGNVYDLAQYVF